MSPQHFTRDDRLKLETYKLAGYSNAHIAGILGYHKSSIGRELGRNSIRGRYQGALADKVSVRRRQEIERNRKIDHPPLRRYVIDMTMNHWSPEEISGRLRLNFGNDPLMQISYESIYLAAYSDERLGPLLIPYWRQARKKRKKRGALKGKREIIQSRVPISKRPEIVAARSRVGDLEGDTVVGCAQSGNIVTLVDRKSLYLWAGLSPTKHSPVVADVIMNVLGEVDPQHLHTITFDNGTEFADHLRISKDLSVDIYFARPYCSNDRARNENTNGLLRQYFPKKFKFDTITPVQLQRVVEEMNNRPRKTLGYRTPAEVFNQEVLRFEFEPAPFPPHRTSEQ